jgi:hypothetical protein
MKQVLLSFLVLIIVIVGGSVALKTIGSNPFSVGAKTGNVTLGSEKDLSLLSKNVKWTPDGHICYITLKNGNKRYFISGNQRTYAIDVPGSLSLAEAVSRNLSVREVFGPDNNTSYRNFYATINSVLQTDPNNLDHLMAFGQYEEQAIRQDGINDYANFTASIGLLESYDGGETWKDLGPVIRGDDFLPPGTKITGAGQPSAIIKDGYVYVYFVDWASGAKVSRPDEISLARTKILTDGSLGTFEYLTSNGFSQFNAALKPVITIPEGSDAGYASLPSVSYNKYLGQYLAVFETNIGFYEATSQDGVSWGNKKLFLSFAKPQSERKEGDVWISYPTLLSDNGEKNDGSTTNAGNLYYGKGTWPNVAHQLTSKPFELN